MLVTSNFKKDDVIVFRLNTGEEIIAKLAEDKIDCYEVIKPLAVVVQDKGPIMAPMMISADWETKIVSIYKTGVTMTCPPVDAIKQAYLKNTSSLVQVETPGLIRGL
jgi:hypothetical protein|tara:strand:+ start:257 stop:577 length:321 start_codon:yes stop_codon:yes gene_type:complete